MKTYYLPVFIYHLGIVFMNFSILKCLKRKAGIWFAGFFSSMVHFITFFANNIITKNFLGGFIGPENIQVFIHQAHRITNRLQHGIEFSFTLPQRLLSLLLLSNVCYDFHNTCYITIRIFNWITANGPDSTIWRSYFSLLWLTSLYSLFKGTGITWVDTFCP